MPPRRDWRSTNAASAHFAMPVRANRNGDLESIEDPSDPKPDDYEKVKAAQRQSVEPERDVRVNDGRREGRLLHLGRFHSRAANRDARRRCRARRRGNAAKSIEFEAIIALRRRRGVRNVASRSVRRHRGGRPGYLPRSATESPASKTPTHPANRGSLLLQWEVLQPERAGLSIVRNLSLALIVRLLQDYSATEDKTKNCP